MLKHIVMWKLKDQARDLPKSENAKEFKRLLDNCANIVDGMFAFETAIAEECGEATYDVILYAEFASDDALKAYQVHPTHAGIKPFVASVTLERQCMDYYV